MRQSGSATERDGHAARSRRRAGRIAAAGAALVTVFSGLSVASAPPAAAGLTEQVIVTSTGLLSPVTAVLDVGGTILQQFHLIDGVLASTLTIEEPILAALPAITLTRHIPAN